MFVMYNICIYMYICIYICIYVYVFITIYYYLLMYSLLGGLPVAEKENFLLKSLLL